MKMKISPAPMEGKKARTAVSMSMEAKGDASGVSNQGRLATTAKLVRYGIKRMT